MEHETICCENCGRNLSYVRVQTFLRDGTDMFWDSPIEPAQQNAAVVEADPNWCGYELSEEERPDTIICPHFQKYPFNSTEIQIYNVVRVVMFRRK